MSLLYTVAAKANPQDRQAEPKWYLQSKIRGNKTHKQILEAAAKNTTLNFKEIDTAVYEWLQAVYSALEDGFSVEVEGLGTFSTSISSNGVAVEAEAVPAKVKDISLAFRAKPEINNRLNNFKLEKFVPTASL
ncbi:MAG: HU family DNA-binding protein [Paludibacter sp.]|jgi:predicted histone-like DNA-binding protein|nr:HU family DNA-binding protein [Paludibacter sp.]